MPVFLVAQITIHDRATYANYEAGFGAIFARYDGTMLAVDDAPEVLEGEWPHSRTVVIQFPTAEAAKHWFNSAEYQLLAEDRKAASVGHVVLLDGMPN